MKKVKIIALLLLTLSTGAFAQDNVVKLNLPPLGLLNFSLQYERVLPVPHSSVALGLGLMPTRGLPFYSLISKYDTSGRIKDIRVSGFTLTPEYRFYVSLKGAPHGFYLAPYLRYSRYSVSWPGSFKDGNGMEHHGTLTGTYSGFGGGLMIGSQWIIAKHVSLDWWILGGHVGKGKFTLSGDSPEFGTLTDADRADIAQSTKDAFSNLPGFGDTKVDFTGSHAEASASTLYFGVRWGFTLGVAF